MTKCKIEGCKFSPRNMSIELCERHYRRFLKHGDYNIRIIERHGYRNHPLYDCWHHIHDRCYSRNCKNYSNYGGRGITCCEEWKSPKDFIEWCLSNGWEQGLQIDRIDNNGNYEPSNCRFSTPKEQMNNTRSNKIIEHNGAVRTLQQWGEYLGIKPNTILYRIRRGWSVGRALGFE